MPAQVRSVGASNSGSGTAATINATMPAGFQAGDLLIGIANGSTTAVPTVRPSGSTPVRNIADANLNMDVVRKTAVGGDTFSWTAAAARKWAVTIVAIIAGTWDEATTFDVENGVNHTAAAATLYTTPSIVVTQLDTLLIAVFGNRAASTWTVPAQTPTMVEGGDTTATGTNPASNCLTHSALNAVPTGAISRQATASVSHADACMWIAAVRPGAAPTPGKWVGPPIGTRRSRASHRAATW